jgi:hypothetical protein
MALLCYLMASLDDALLHLDLESAQGLQQSQLLADYFATSSHNNTQVYFSQSSCLCCKGVAKAFLL